MDATLSKLNDLRCGMCRDCWAVLGAHPQADGVQFAVWAPDARTVAVIGPWNDWKPVDLLRPAGSTGVWHGSVPGAAPGDLYKYFIEMHDGSTREKADPVAFETELPPGTASRIPTPMDFLWYDATWLAHRPGRDLRAQPFSILYADPADWADEAGNCPSWPALAKQLIPRARACGHTHICLRGVLEHPRTGREITGYFAPTARSGSPAGLRQLVDECHRSSLGVFLEWTPGVFAPEYFGLGRFNGTPLYETWQTAPSGCYRFDLSSGPVRSFLTSCALFWLREYHFDGLQFTDLPTMLELRPGEPDPDAATFLRALNRAIHHDCPGALTIAQDCPDAAQYGFDFHWDIRWRAETSRLFSSCEATAAELRALLTCPDDPTAILPLPRQLDGSALAALWQYACPGAVLRPDSDACPDVGMTALNEPALWGAGSLTWAEDAAPLLPLLRTTAGETVRIVLNPTDTPQTYIPPDGEWSCVCTTGGVPEETTASIPVPARGGCILRRKPEHTTLPEDPATQEEHQ